MFRFQTPPTVFWLKAKARSNGGGAWLVALNLLRENITRHLIARPGVPETNGQHAE
jgi:hypothetical protein